MTATEQQARCNDLPGQAAKRQDGSLFVTGKVRYAADTVDDNYHHVVFARSEVAHARIMRIDVSEALAVPGVTAVILAEDLAGVDIVKMVAQSTSHHHQSVTVDYLARSTVLYIGQPYAAVVATTVEAARLAASRVRVYLEALPVVVTAGEALADNAPLLHEEWGTNVFAEGVTGTGEPFDAELDEARELTLEGELRMARCSIAPLEPRACQATWDSRLGRLRWYGTTQNPHAVRLRIARALGVDETQVHVVSPPQGGSFGSKQAGHLDEVLIAVLARMLGVPLRWDETRWEALLLGSKDQTVSFRATFDSTGRVHCIRGRVVANLGAITPTAASEMPVVGALTVPSGYDIQRASTEWKIVVSNKAPWGSARPFGKEIAAIITERIMDEVAKRTGLDPLDVRRRNWIDPENFPYDMATGLQIDSGNYAGLADKVSSVFDYDNACKDRASARDAGRLVGIGWGFELMPESGDPPGALGGSWDTATVRMDATGSVTVLTGVTSPGNGNETGIAQIVAAELGVSIRKIRVVQGDTDRSSLGGGNYSSRSIVLGGAAAHLAATDVSAKLRTVAAGMLHCSEDAVVLRGGRAIDTSAAASEIDIPAVAYAMLTSNRIVAPHIEPGLESTRTFSMKNVRHGKGENNHWSTYASALYVCQVEIDEETGIVSVERHAMAHDCGTVINPELVDGQFCGGVAMGLGEALMEAVPYDMAGNSLADSFKTYLLPRAIEIPPFNLAHQVTPSPFSFMGVKGAGESGIGCSVVALLNAVNDALSPYGVQVNELPITPAVVQRALAASSEKAC
ncbi:xanthine dehydrogenase family protein molybdopterin-binding subunit [Nocardia sp. NPDC059239]|uniref:xanthine dehydrogenase family protein molybdopterin-binding subunit n=1 Tax=Nocardia sp. NPDC059239 TaxID=3346785 RepID=UPI0036A27E25